MTLDFSESLKRFLAIEQENAKLCETLEKRHSEEREELRDYIEIRNPYKIALGEYYTPETVEILAGKLREYERARRQDPHPS